MYSQSGINTEIRTLRLKYNIDICFPPNHPQIQLQQQTFTTCKKK